MRRDIDTCIHQLTLIAARSHNQNIESVLRAAPFAAYVREYEMDDQKARELAAEVVRRQAMGEDIATYLNNHAVFLRKQQAHGKERRARRR